MAALGLSSGTVLVPSRGPERGFTLLEILIVVSILALLAGLLVPMLQKGGTAAKEALARTEVAGLDVALQRYVEDEGALPLGRRRDADPENEFPALYEALAGERAPAGGGGRSAPYSRFEERRLRVMDPEKGELRPATRAEAADRRIEKLFLDPFGNPYVYRANRGRQPGEFAVRRRWADIYSTGVDGVDDTVESPGAESDDLGNW